MKNPTHTAMLGFAGATLAATLYLCIGQPLSGEMAQSANSAMADKLIPVFTFILGAVIKDWLGGE
jgi:hypothetical protein